MSLEVGWRLDRGRRRRKNEDRLLVCLPTGGQGEAGSVFLLAVADGMGGGPAGELASQIATRTLEGGFEPELFYNPVTRLRSLFEEANREMRRLAESEPAHEGMGSTLVAVLIADGQLWVANVGDSRAYLIREERITQLTQDHSWVAEQVRAGQIGRDEAARSPRKNIITRSLGTAPDVEVDTFGFGELQLGDTILLCSDGLHSVVDNRTITECCVAYRPQEAADRLVELANRQGGPDNIAVVVGRWTLAS
jgi:serine/threonine protein phosphatase PrpC